MMRGYVWCSYNMIVEWLIIMTVCFNFHGSIAIGVIMVWPSTVFAMNIIGFPLRDGHRVLKQNVLLQFGRFMGMRSGLLLLPHYIY
jgi:hypothetical protein